MKAALGWLFLAYALWLTVPIIMQAGSVWVGLALLLLVIFLCSPPRPDY